MADLEAKLAQLTAEFNAANSDKQEVHGTVVLWMLPVIGIDVARRRSPFLGQRDVGFISVSIIRSIAKYQQL